MGDSIFCSIPFHSILVYPILSYPTLFYLSSFLNYYFNASVKHYIDFYDLHSGLRPGQDERIITILVVLSRAGLGGI